MEIKRFNQFLSEMKKEYGQPYSLMDIKVGDRVKYTGSSYYVITANEVVLELSKDKNAKPGERENFFVNQNMFKERGAIAD